MTRLTSKHQNETGDLKYLLQESELSKKELQNELNVYKSKLSGDEDSVEELQNKLSQMKLRCEQAERKCSDLIEENERLTEDMSSVSNLLAVLNFCGIPDQMAVVNEKKKKRQKKKQQQQQQQNNSTFFLTLHESIYIYIYICIFFGFVLRNKI